MNLSPAHRNLFLIAGALASAALLLSLLLLLTGLGELNFFLAVSVIVFGLAPIIRSIVRRQDYFEIINIFCLLFVISMAIRGLTIIYSDSQWLVSYDRDSEAYMGVMFAGFVYSLLALAALYLGYWSKLGVKAGMRIPGVSFLPKNRSGLLAVTSVALIIGTLGSYLFLMDAGGLKVMSDSSTMIEEGIESGGGLYYSLLLDFAVIGFLFLYTGMAGLRKGVPETVLFALFGVLMAFNFLMLPFKGHIIGVLLYLLVVSNYLIKRISIGKIAVVALVISVLVLPVLNNYRKHGISSLDQIWSDSSSELSSFGLINNASERSAGADMFFLALERTPEPNPWLYGSSFTKVLTSFIPRPLYPDKPWSYGVDFSNNYLDTPLKASVSPSTVGELYVNFHVVGIMAGFFVIGVFLRTVYSWCISSGVSREGVIIYAIIFEKMVMLVDGPVADFIVFVLIRLFPVAVLGLLAVALGGRSIRKQAPADFGQGPAATESPR